MKIKRLTVPLRRLGHSFTTSKGKTYVTFDGGSLYRVDFRTGEVVDISDVPEASGIRSQMPSYQGVSRWAYKLLRTNRPRVVELHKSTVETESVEMVEPVEIDIPIKVEQSMVSPEPKQVKVFWKKTGGRTIVLVLLHDDDPKKSLVFHLNQDRQASRCLNGSKGQSYSIEKLIEMDWQQGNLDQFQMVSDLVVIKEQISQAA